MANKVLLPQRTTSPLYRAKRYVDFAAGMPDPARAERQERLKQLSARQPVPRTSDQPPSPGGLALDLVALELTLSRIGLVLIDGPLDFSAVTSVEFDDYFTSEFTHYLIVLSPFLRSTTGDLRFQFRLAGVDVTASNYYSGTWTVLSSAATGATGFAAGASWVVWEDNAATVTDGQVFIRVCNPAIAAETTFSMDGAARFATGAMAEIGGGMHNVATAYDGFKLAPVSGTLTGSVSIYGYQELP